MFMYPFNVPIPSTFHFDLDSYYEGGMVGNRTLIVSGVKMDQFQLFKRLKLSTSDFLFIHAVENSFWSINQSINCYTN